MFIIISISDDINIHHAQLIFNMHNPIFLNSNLFRRDEIKFVERDDGSHFSTLYALSDFGTTGEKGVRKHEDYMSRYFISQYGAIKDIDFTPIFEDILESESAVLRMARLNCDNRCNKSRKKVKLFTDTPIKLWYDVIKSY